MTKKPAKKPATDLAFLTREGRVLPEKWVDVEDLVEDDENPNTHDEDDIAAKMASFKAHGQVHGLVVQHGTNRVADGNGRVEALRRLGVTKALVKPVKCTDDEFRALGIALNRTAKMSRFDDDVLAVHLETLKDAGLLEATTYSSDELEDLLSSLEKPEPPKGGPLEIDGSTARMNVDCPKCGHTFKVGGK